MKLFVDSHTSVEIDSEDLSIFISNSWRVSKKDKEFPYVVNKNGKALHRIIMNVHEFHLKVDHINGNTLDNRKENLRLVDNRTNSQNTRALREGKRCSKYVGVTKASKSSWRARTWIKGMGHVSIGCYATEELAAKAYDNYMIKNFKTSDRGLLNFS